MIYREEDAVSPVIGVILMVAVTVVLAVAVFMIANQYTGMGGESQSIISIQARDAPAVLNSRTSDPIAILTLTQLRGSPYELSALTFRVSRDGVSWSPVAQNPSSGPWMAGVSVTLTELSPDQMSAGPCYVSVYSYTESGASEIYKSGVLYIT
jgi:flagellin-like protein